MMFLGYHLWLVGSDLTTNENMKGAEASPNNNCKHSCWALLCASKPSSLLNLRGEARSREGTHHSIDFLLPPFQTQLSKKKNPPLPPGPKPSLAGLEVQSYTSTSPDGLGGDGDLAATHNEKKKKSKRQHSPSTSSSGSSPYSSDSTEEEEDDNGRVGIAADG